MPVYELGAHRMTIEYQDTWPETPRLLWRWRHASVSENGWHRTQRACPTCSHGYSIGMYRAHLRSAAHRTNRGWWRS